MVIMYKKKLTLSIDNELIDIFKKVKMNISEFLELCLIEKFRLEKVDLLYKNIKE